MPQLRKQGKYVFGWSFVRKDNVINFPEEVIEEYKIENNSDIIIFSSSKISGGFCISVLEILKSSKLSGIIENNSELEDERNIEKIIKYKGKKYCHIKIINNNQIKLSKEILDNFGVKVGEKLLIVRGSNIAFNCLVKGPLVKLANESQKEIKFF